MAKSSLIPVWRLREIRNIADTMAYRAGLCPVARLALVAERMFLKPTAHIRLFIDPQLGIGEAYHYIQVLDGARYASSPRSTTNLIEITICFNGNLTSKEKWRRTTRAIVRELGRIIFFSLAAKRVELIDNETAFLEDFVNEVLRKEPFTFDSTSRPRLMLAYLREIVRSDLHGETRGVLPHMRRLLMPYLGSDGW